MPKKSRKRTVRHKGHRKKAHKKALKRKQGKTPRKASRKGKHSKVKKLLEWLRLHRQ